MSSIRYPAPLQHGDLIGVSAPSSGVEPPNHPLLAKAKTALERLGYVVEEGDTIWQNDKCVSASSLVRAQEWKRFLLDERIKAVIPPWGGEFLMELLPLLDWERLARAKPKWVLGFSDISTFTFAYTLMTGHASAHGPSYA